MGVAAHASFGGFTLVATSAYHVVRVTVRVSVVTLHRDIDVTLPTSSTLAEVLPELARLIDLPDIHRPWVASTAGGAPLDMHTPLHRLKLYDGCIVTLTPAEPAAPPVVRDAAESLRAAAEGAGEARGLAAAAGMAGAACAGLLTGAFTGLPAALAVGGLALVVIAMFTRSAAMFAPVPYVLGAAAGCWVSGPRAEWLSAVDPAIGALVGAVASVAVTGAGAVLGLAGPAQVAFACTSGAVTACSAVGAWFPAVTAPAALGVLACVLAVMVTPGVASRAAGLRIPRIPTAGEEFDTSDGYQADVDTRSARAVTIAGAMTAASAVCAVPALGVLGWRGGAWVLGFSLCTAGAVGLHALRHHYAVPRSALVGFALAAALAGVGAAARTPNPHPVAVAVAILAVLLVGSAPLWAPRLGELEPTTVVWFERAEMAAIIAVIPLAVHLTGTFAMIRGL